MKNGLATLDEFTGIKVADIDALDILELNFHAARGLPGTENSNLEDWLKKRDEWASYARLVICRYLHEFDPESKEEPTPGTYGNSLAHFLCWYLGQALCWCGVKYHPDRRSDPESCLPPEVFAHGILDDGGKGGSCASIPVVVVSVARRIGLPLFLVSTRGHGFFRWVSPNGTKICWEDPCLNLWIPPAQFNIDSTGEGISFNNDEYYRQCPSVWKTTDARDSRHLKAKTPREELGLFLMERGECFWGLGQHEEALKSYFYARQLITDDPRFDYIHDLRSRTVLEWEAAARALDERLWLEDRRRIAGAVGHSPNCECGECRRLRLERPSLNAAQVPVRLVHIAGCKCANCRVVGSQQAAFPDHGPSCQCFHCRESKAVAATKTMTGHTSSCRCTACLSQRQLAPVP